MTKSKGIEPALQAAGAIQNMTMILANRTAVRGGNYTEAVVRLGTGERRYGVEYDQIADILTAISIAPEGGRVHILRDIPVDEWTSWKNAIDWSCPTTASDSFFQHSPHSVHNVGEQYPAAEIRDRVLRTIVLVTFGSQTPSLDSVAAWGKEHKLLPASPRAVFALVRNRANLFEEFRMELICIASLQACTISGGRFLPVVWFNPGGHAAGLRSANDNFKNAYLAFVLAERAVV